MKVLHVITGLNTGGAEIALCRSLESLHAPAFQHVVVALGPEGALSARVRAVAQLYHMDMKRARATPADVWRLRRLLGQMRPAVVQGWMYHANIMASVASAGLGIPVIWGMRQSLYSLAGERRATRWVIRAGGWLSRYPKAIVYNSSVSREQHMHFGIKDASACVIPNGFDTLTFAPDNVARGRVRAELRIAPHDLVIGLVARVHPMKDHANFLHAAARFAGDHPDAVFVLVGDGTDAASKELAPLVGELGLADKIRLCGRRTDIAAVNNAFDTAASSSCGEAFPNSIGEAMACGVPCAATNVGDVPKIIGDTGVVVPPRDPAALAAGWAKLAALKPEGRRALGLRARQRIIDRYSLAANARAYADLYRSLAGKGAVCAA